MFITSVFYVAFFWSAGIMVCMLLTFEKKNSLMRYGASVMRHFLNPLMNSFNRTDAAIPMHTIPPEDFHFFSLKY